ncbi:Sec-independent protein translocase protein TatB [Luteibacter aegosomaticola]|jgi:sec-independent protein translocase protein TatB|uniref:Sec-independent protein translocase protein TatB n=1 Tax=Luteibacter aegosomaticola TaxID=2911538 RepID=UPI001FF971AC|nr:Sec-independent protein translocase protein TatB [Luteibacter aegosomaticola]UPG89686.1 Sec-independent protein translocase protein TatB [Luteibacter aegosomaticola]
MIEISFGKLLLLALVALIVIGPERLPHAARTAGALLRRVRNGWDSVKSEVEREIQAEEIKRTLRETAESARAAQDDVQKNFRDAGQGVSGAFRDTEAQVRDAYSEAQSAHAGRREPDPERDMLPLNPGEAPGRNEPHDRT